MHTSFRLDTALLLAATGRFDRAAANLVHDDIRLALADGVLDLTLDLTMVGEVDELAVEELAAVACSIAVRNRRLHIAAPDGSEFAAADPMVVRDRLGAHRR